MKEQQREKKILQKNASGKKRKGVSSQPKEVLHSVMMMTMDVCV